MEEIKETLQLLNPWWKSGKVEENLARPYKRKAFNEIIGLLDYRQITILSGLRRVGKTTLLYQTIEHLLKKTDQQKILYFTFDKKIESLIKLLNNYTELTGIEWKGETIFVFLDEISKLANWAGEIKILYDAYPNLKFFLSSSSSTSLEEDAIKILGGRYFLRNIKPLSFPEYLEIKGKGEYISKPLLWLEEIKKEVRSYFLRSFPEITDWKDELAIKDYLRTTIIDKIVKADISERFKQVNKELLFNLLEIFYTEPGMYLDYDGLSKTLRISKNTLSDHIYYLEFAYLIRRVKNFRVRPLVSSRKLQRIYPYWWSLACCYSENADKIFENMVGSILDSKYYWRKNGMEIDFLSMDKNKILPYEAKNKIRLTASDAENMKHFLEKYEIENGIIVYNGEEELEIKMNNKKIICLPLWKFLLESGKRSQASPVNKQG